MTRPSVVERVTQILDVVMAHAGWVLLEEISGHTGLPRSTAFRILGQLTDLGWLEHGPRGYRLGARSHGVRARSHNDYDGLREAATAPLNELHGHTGAVAHLSVLEGACVHHLDKIGGAAAHTVPSRVGGRISADRTASGKALLACLTPEHVDHLVQSTANGRGLPDLSNLHQQLDAVRRRHGIATNVGQCRRGISGIAAPILGPRGPIGAIALAGTSTLHFQRLAPIVAHAARRTSALLFPDWAVPTGLNGAGRALVGRSD
ncbi:IclR family transcriptional regulator [Nocardioides sp. Bht2]|uniref:IclR family transcriptional regulator n=1 Tax=Nocardioides sp. Bht2 TaxID=3392297 RepID=UPI0039B5E6A3